MSLKILILGANGFIGSHLVEHILQHKDWEIHALDLNDNKITPWRSHARLHFKQGDLTRESAWVEAQVQTCDVVLPLVAIANPTLYVQDPVRVFELDFEANLAVVRLCVKYGKRVIFPSTSEVYGMCPDPQFDEETSPLVLGPVQKSRWIYSCSKQLMDRLIIAYGQRDHLPYTLFRPFNWMGPRLDNFLDPTPGTSRAFSQFLGNVLRGQPIQLVNGGTQKRCFTYIDDAIDALLRIIENPTASQGRIFNIGNPHNNISIRTLAETLIEEVQHYPAYAEHAKRVELVDIPGQEYFGSGYQDVDNRVPSIKNAQQHLGWTPSTHIRTAIQKTLAVVLA